jgi:hypothetical protein
MAYNGSGTFLINTAGQPVVAGTVISSTTFNSLTADLATGLSTVITKDGQTTVTANIPMASFKFTGLGVGSAAGDSATLSQVQSTVTKLLTSVSGADTITAVGAPVLSAYAAGQMFYFVATGDNTTSVTINIDGLGAKAVTRDGSVALVAGDIKSGEVVVVVYDGTRFQVVSQLNSAGNATFANVSITSALNVGGIATFAAGTAGAPAITTTGDTNTGLFFPAADSIGFSEGGVEAMRIDSSGNLGLGVTPSAWGSTFAGGVFQAKNASVLGYLNAVYLGANYYATNSTDNYIATGFASRYQQTSGQHQWLTAASGTAGNAITFTQAMTLDASGNLGIGTSSPTYKLDVQGTTAAGYVGQSLTNNSSTGYVQQAFRVGSNAANGGAGIFYAPGTFFAIGVVENDTTTPITFVTNNSTERARILSGGNFIVGGTSATEGGLFVTSFNGAAVPGVVIADTSATTTANMVFFHKSGAVRGSIQTTASATAYNTSSDRRLKDNISPADNAGAVIDAIEVVKHDWKVGGHTRYGMIAQDLHMVAPEAVSVGDADDVEELKRPWGVDYSKLVPMLVKELQSLRARVAQLESK